MCPKADVGPALGVIGKGEGNLPALLRDWIRQAEETRFLTE